MKKSKKPNLNNYASTIALVFEKFAGLYNADRATIAELYELNSLAGRIDADTVAEIISVAKEVDK